MSISEIRAQVDAGLKELEDAPLEAERRSMGEMRIAAVGLEDSLSDALGAFRQAEAHIVTLNGIAAEIGMRATDAQGMITAATKGSDREEAVDLRAAAKHVKDVVDRHANIAASFSAVFDALRPAMGIIATELPRLDALQAEADLDTDDSPMAAERNLVEKADDYKRTL